MHAVKAAEARGDWQWEEKVLKDIFEELDQECIQLGKMIGALIKKRGNKISR
jgi:hypothetical protein